MRTAIGPFLQRAYCSSVPLAAHEISSLALGVSVAFGGGRDLSPRVVSAERRKILSLIPNEAKEEREAYKDLLFALADAHLEAGDFSASQRVIETVLAADHTNWRALSRLGVVQGRQGKIAAALQSFERAERFFSAFQQRDAIDRATQEEILEAKAAETRARLDQLFALDQSAVTADAIFEVLEPVFTDASMVSLARELVANLLDRGVELSIIASVFGRRIEGENETRVYEPVGQSLLQLTAKVFFVGGRASSGLVPTRLAVAVAVLQEREIDALDIYLLFREQGLAREVAVLLAPQEVWEEVADASGMADWVFSIFEVRVAITSVSSDVGGSELFDFLRPAFIGATVFVEGEAIRNFYNTQLEAMVSVLQSREFPLANIAYAFSRPIEDEEMIKPLESLEEVPARLGRALGVLVPEGGDVSADVASLKQIHAAFSLAEQMLESEARGLAANVIALCTYLRMDEIFSAQGAQGRSHASGLIKRLGRLKILVGTMARELRAELKHMAAVAKTLAARDSLMAELDQLKHVGRNLANDPSQLVERVFAVAGKIEAPAERVKLYDSVIDLIEARLDYAQKESLVNLLLLVDALWGREAILTARLRETAVAALEKPDQRARITGVLKKIRADMAVTAKNVVDGKHAEIKLAKPMYPLKGGFIRRERVHDLFFERMRRHPEVIAIFGEVEQPFASPVALRSSWFGMLAGHGRDDSRKVSLLKRSLDLDPENLTSRLKLARYLSRTGQRAAGERMLGQLLSSPPSSLVWVKACAIRSANLGKEVDVLASKLDSDEELKVKVGEAKALHARLRSMLDGEEAVTLFSDDDWALALSNLGHVFSVTHVLDDAYRLYALIAEAAPATGSLGEVYHNAVKIGGYSLLKQGSFPAAAGFFSQALSKCRVLTRLPNYYEYVGYSLFCCGDYSKALAAVEKGLRILPSHKGLLQTKVRILTATGQLAQARKIFDEIIASDEETLGQFADRPEMLRNIEGFRSVTRAELKLVSGKRDEAIADFRHAVELFSQDYVSEYAEIDARWRLARALSFIGIQDKDVDLLFDSIEEVNLLVERFPFFLPAYEVPIGPLITLGREAEALDVFDYLLQQGARPSDVALANLIQVALADNEVRDRAREIFVSIRKKAREEGQEETFAATLVDAKQKVVIFYPDWDDGRMDAMDEWGTE